MKKRLALIMLCVIFITSLIPVSVNCDEFAGQIGYNIEFNGESIDCYSIIYNDTHYVPLRKVFENMGAFVFHRSRDNQILALSRDGDVISHIIGDNKVIVNGEEKILKSPSVSLEYQTFIPIEMVTASLNPDRILYDDQKLNIQKYLFNNNYHKIIKEVLDVCKNSNFYPERFKRYIDYHVEKADLSIEEVIFRVNLGLDYPFYQNVTVVEDPYALLVLVNKYNQLPNGYEQYNLVNMKREHTSNDGKQYLLAGVAYDKYIEMSEAIKKDGLSMRVVSAYRTENYQRNLYNNRVRTTGRINADNYSARPGHSEHQTGLAVDIGTTKGVFEYTPEFKWLQNHAHEYGFILRYPKGKEWITGYSYEPWHYRYVGVDAAKIIYEEGITYEEYYAKYVSVNEFK